MTQTVFSNNMVAHVWAQQRQESGRSNNGNFYFTGRRLYSYGTHFLVGIIMPDGVALLNKDSYSISTTQHQGDAAGATRHRTQHYIPRLTEIGDYLNWAAESLKDGESAAQWRKTIRAFLEKQAETISDEPNKWSPGISDEAGLYLCRLVGIPARQWDIIKRKAAANIVRRRKAAERAATKEAATFADIPAAEMQQRLRRMARENDTRGIDRLLTEARRYHKRAAKSLSESRKKKAWNHVKMIQAELADAHDKLNIRERIRPLRRAIEQFRANLDRVRELGLERVSHSPLFNLAAIASRLKDYPRIPLATKGKLARIDADIQAVLPAVREMETERLAAERAERERIAALEDAERRRLWLAGDRAAFPARGSRWDDGAGGTLLRAVDVERNEAGEVTGGTLETSMGASVPLCHAIRAFRFLKLCRESGRPWEANGRMIRVGHFRIDRVEPSGDMVAGCHRINWGETERLARELGVFALPAAETALEPR